MTLVLAKSREKNIENTRIVCDHIKALAFLFSEGAPLPGRNGRERIIRKLVRSLLTKLIVMGIASKELLPDLIDIIISIYPENRELKKSKDKILKIVYDHEVIYSKTLASAKRRIEEYLKRVSRGKPTEYDRKYFIEHFGIPKELQIFYHYV
jgi:alanyl-tRNA synthetase